MKSEIPQDVVDFQPDAIQIRDEKLPLWARLSVWSLFALFALAILWSCFARVDVIVQAGGKLVSNKQTLVIKPIETSIIEKVNVQVGDIVNEGDILITFDPTINKAEVDRLNREIRVLSSQISRLGAEFDGKDYKPTAQDGETGIMQKSIFDQRRKYYDERIVYYNSALQQLDASKKSREDNLAKQKERLVVVRKMEQMYSDLHEKNAASLKDTWNIQITRMEMESTVDQLQNSLLELVHQRESTAASRNSFIQEWRNSISEEKVKLERELDANLKTLEKYKQLVSYVYLRSPCKAVVHEIAPLSIGSAAREAEAVMTLIPLDGVIEMEAEVRPQDISRIKRGDTARIKLDAYPFQKYGTMDGILRIISQDTLVRQEQPTIERPNQTYYRARIRVSGKLHKTPKNFHLIPGMVAQAEIKIGRRRVIEYVVHPLIKMFDEAAREP